MRFNIAWSLVAATFLAFASSSASASTLTVTEGWEDGVSTVVGTFGNVANVANVDSGTEIINNVAGNSVSPNGGSRMLTVSEAPHGGTPQALLAFVEGLTDGDTVTASFFGYDSTDGASPSMRVWGHYANSGDVNSYAGSAGGNSTYTGGATAGWFEVDHTWTFDSDTGSRDALVVEARLYSSPSTDDNAATSYFIDDLSVEVNAAGAFSITVPSGTVAVPEPASALLALVGMTALGLRTRRS